MILHTTSEVISLAKKLETDTADFYDKMSQKYPEGSEEFNSFVKENKKNIVNTERTYFGVITDAIEGGYAFNLESDDYVIDTGLADGTNYLDAMQKAIEVEKKMVDFYKISSEQSQGLMADVPRAFKLLSQKKSQRLLKLESMAKCA
jgi:hypothetical protein